MMITIKTFVCNPFQENTYLLSDETGNCVIVDPGCSDDSEILEVENYMTQHKLTLEKIILTHGHIDHFWGLPYFYNKCKLQPYIHSADLALLNIAPQQAQMFGLAFEQFNVLFQSIDDISILKFGNNHLKILHVPGHSPGSIALYNENDAFVITGDVIFKGSIGRTDLLNGDYHALINSIQKKIFTLPDNTLIFPGHGPYSTIIYEKTNNPFVSFL